MKTTGSKRAQMRRKIAELAARLGYLSLFMPLLEKDRKQEYAQLQAKLKEEPKQ